MIGTITEDALEIDLIPPKITSAEKAVMIMPVIQVSIPKLFSTASATVLDCTELPLLKDASLPNKSKIRASHVHVRPGTMSYIGPPDISPFSFLIRYLTARTPSPYLVAIPNSAVIHIQNTAPGPPSTQAVATPAILPVPIVADSAVISEANWEISPECSGCLPKSCLKASGNIRNCQNNKRKVRNIPVPTISTSI